MEIRAGIDWFSASRADGPGSWEWAMKGIHAINSIADQGNELKARCLNGYQGVSAGGSFVGTRYDGYFVQVTSHHADVWFDELYCEECSPTRVDIQATVLYDEYMDDIGAQCYVQSANYAELQPTNKRWRVYRLEGTDEGYTCYVGASSAQQRACIYNKDRESKDPNFRNAWRYEVRFRGEYASKWALLLSDRSAVREAHILEAVATWLASRGITRGELGDSEGIVLPKIATRRTDVERRLEWIRTQVRPSIKWLQDRVERDTLLVALGLAEQGPLSPSEL